MKVAQIQFARWDKIYHFSPNNIALEKGDRVIVETELGQEMGELVGFEEVEDKAGSVEIVISSEINAAGEEEKKIEKREIKPILRKANQNDFEKLPSKKEKEEAFEYCRQMIEKRDLPMKLVDVVFSFAGNRINFAFIADGRVDFRDLVKDLTGHFSKQIRLTQIGIRDEARLSGDYGHCGRPLCCKKFIRDFSSISSEMAEAQQVVHRGSERISGCCGRLMCCLQYEYQGYKEMAEKMPSLGQKVNVDGKKGVVVGAHVLKQSVDVQFEDPKEGKIVIEVDLNRRKK
ncbi:MAG TPA: regulatory iron-sulfur-containing complex subunit RicT [Candidatus Nanoarchaeia archaeon]|nr:regulatory iron-sulfur-containing complex subunit RicT [Candidatus Nanoarchaeia archaeon]